MSILSIHIHLRRVLALGVSAALLLPIVPAAAAAPASGPDARTSVVSLPSGEQRVLRIGSLWSGSDDTYMRMIFTDFYELTHPEVKLEFVPAVDLEQTRFINPYRMEAPDKIEHMRKIMLGSYPVDVIMGDSNLIRSLADQNLLAPLQPLIDRDGYDLSNMAPTMLNGVRELGRGHLFALAPTFNACALFYNKGIFDAAGVPYPEDGMTWDEMFALAGKVTKATGPEKGRIYGFSMARYLSEPFWNMQTYLTPLQATVTDKQGGVMTVNNEVWRAGWTTFSKLIQKKIIPGPEDLEEPVPEETPEIENIPIRGDLFMSGEAAMVLAEYGYMNELAAVDRNASRIKNYSPVDWGIVEVPAFAENPGVAVGASLDNMLAISSTAQNREDAWELIQFANSNEVARIKANNRYQPVSRMNFNLPQKAGVSLEPFFNLKPVPQTDALVNNLQERMPGIYQLNLAGQMLFSEVIQGKRTLANALTAWEQQGNYMLNELRKNPEAVFNLNSGWLEKSRKGK